ncbi:DNA topoisomerase 2-binding protein 1 isoform X2 [Ceratina calcarata]|uniref:DNA topoisomerase 2-binding protein 1 isoform X2 n=1 Tax=Ceratina calcarata TaxID=156304 RepID=A0AAJ7J7Z0_9HYME|nr:DNA topoisomerase 2-binding protein 1 isoform X2 [Ceratina calcarata]
MTTQDSQLDADVKIYFVILSKLESENDCGEDTWNAFNKCSEYNLDPVWITEKQCGKMQPTKGDVFILEEFAGDTFDRLKTFKCSIIGPRCLLICFANGEPIPAGTNPVYTTAMRNLCICASGLSPEEKENVQKLVEYMGGLFTKPLRSHVTHLVTGSVFSAKYERAAMDMKIPIVTKKWVEAIWEENLKHFTKPDDEIFDKYKAPVFLNLIVTATNLQKRQKEELKRLIGDNGGTLMGPLDPSIVKVVLVPENSPMSEKLKFAKKMNIPCLLPDWVYDSIKVGYALPFKDYLIKTLTACSTPERSNVDASIDCSSISTITCDAPQRSCISESLTNPFLDSMSHTSTVSENSIVDRLTFGEAKAAGPFLDGCCIYLAGFSTQQRDKINRILNVGSATRLDDISDAITHVIVGDKSKAGAELKLLKSKRLSPYILTIDWLEQSIKLKQPAPEENFFCEQRNNTIQNVTEAPSPLSKKNLQMLQKPRKVPIPSFDIDRKLAMLEKEKEKESSDLLQQYLQNTTGETREKTMEETFKTHMSTSEGNNDKTLITNEVNERTGPRESVKRATSQSKYVADDSAMPASQASTLNYRLFEGLTFVVTGFSDEDSYVVETIAAMGGRIVPNNYAGIPDFGVVPKCGAPLKHTVNEIVTDLFVEDCVAHEQVVDIEYYHRPLNMKKHSNPLSGCVITMSVYAGVERTYLAALATEMGAMCQDIFVRKTNREKNTYGSTHLVCPTPEGNKYQAAVKWKLPAVRAEWLRSCAAETKRVDETPFLVGETQVPERPSQVCDTSQVSPAEPLTRKIVTPKRHLPSLQSQESSFGNTSIVNKRLASVMNTSAQSPFHVSTPESPYGQIFKPNPSPETRKMWAKWINGFPDLRVEEPPLKKRPLSTPLSELKKQLWKKLRSYHEEDTVSGENDAPEEAEREDNSRMGAGTSINRKLDFADENSPQNTEINMQLAQLDELLQKTSNTSDRYSLSGENANSYKVPTPDAIEKCMVKDSQLVDAIVWEDPSHSKRLMIRDEGNENKEDCDSDGQREQFESPKRPKFMLSGIKDRTAYEDVIKRLGGDVSTDATFDMSASHVLCIRPSRNEKMLSSIATGKWILHCMYMRDCDQEGRFLDEEKYEWGNPKSKGIIPDPTGDIEEAIAAAAFRWRVKLLKEPDACPFHNMVALLLAEGDKYEMFKRLIEVGGGTVVQARPPYDSPTGKKITHCFVNIKQVSQPINWAMLASKGIFCFLPQYLSDYLTSQTPLNPRECVIPEFKKYLTLLPK